MKEEQLSEIEFSRSARNLYSLFWGRPVWICYGGHGARVSPLTGQPAPPYTYQLTLTIDTIYLGFWKPDAKLLKKWSGAGQVGLWEISDIGKSSWDDFISALTESGATFDRFQYDDACARIQFRDLSESDQSIAAVSVTPAEDEINTNTRKEIVLSYWNWMVEKVRNDSIDMEQTVNDTRPQSKQGLAGGRVERIRVPIKGAVYRRWRRTWLKIKGQVSQGKSTQEIAGWLQTMKGEGGTYSAETLADIIAAGEAGKLDD